MSEKRRLVRAIVALFVCPFLLIAVPAGAADDKGAAPAGAVTTGNGDHTDWGPTSNGLQCRFIPGWQKVGPPEERGTENPPALLTFQLRNSGEKPLIVLPGALTSLYPWVEGIRMTSPDGQPAQWIGPVPSIVKAPVTRESFVNSLLRVAPGETISRRDSLSYDFNEPGRYEMSFSFVSKPAPENEWIMLYYDGDVEKAVKNADNFWTGELRSNTAVIFVAEPGGKMAWGRPANGLQSRLTSPRQVVEVVRGQAPEDIAVRLTYEVRSAGEKATRFLAWGTPLDALQDADFTVVGPGGQRVASYGGNLPDRRGPSRKDFLLIVPEMTVSRQVRLTYDFSQPGTYLVSFSTSMRAGRDSPQIVGYYGGYAGADENAENVWTGTMSSNTVAVKVVSGTVPSSIGSEQVPWGPIPNALQCRLLPERRTVHVSSQRDTHVKLTYELSNLGDKPVMFLPWSTPLEGVRDNIFTVLRADGGEVNYLGPARERLEPEAKDFTPILPGTTVTRTVRLPYNFDRPGLATPPGLYLISTTTVRQPPPNGPEITAYYEHFLERAQHNPDNVWVGQLASNVVSLEIRPDPDARPRTILSLPEALDLASSFANKALEAKAFHDADGNALSYPKILPSDWRVAAKEGNRWRLMHGKGIVGFECHVSFFLDGSAPKLDGAGFATE